MDQDGRQILICRCHCQAQRLAERDQQQSISEINRLIQVLGLNDTYILVDRDTIKRVEKAEAALDAALAYIRGCPVHGNAACPEEYMLNKNGTPYWRYTSEWRESYRCGLRPARPILKEET
jgi:hypothetical protein